MYLRGSAAREDWIPGLSDVDFYIVVKDDLQHARTTIRLEFDRAMQSLFLEPQVSCRVVTESEVRTNHVASCLSGLEAKLLSGDSILEAQQKPDSSELQAYGRYYLSYLNQYWAKVRSQMNTFEGDVRRLDYLVLKSAQSILMANGAVALRKDEAAKLFLHRFGDHPFAHVVEEAREIRSSWPEPAKHPQKLALFRKDATFFLSGLGNYLKASQTRDSG